MARRFTTWGGIRINTNKTPEQIVNQLNRQMRQATRSYVSVDTFNKSELNRTQIASSVGAKRYGIEYDRDTDSFRLNKKGQMNSQTPIAAMGGTNG